MVKILLMFSTGLHIMESGLMNFNNDVCPSLKAVGQAKLRIHMCICVTTSATGFLSKYCMVLRMWLFMPSVFILSSSGLPFK